jgi:hypothetical protein
VLLQLVTKDTVHGAMDISINLQLLLMCGGLSYAEKPCQCNAASQIKKTL